MEHFLVKVLIGFFASHAEENVASYELMNDFAVGRQAVENDILVIVKLDHHVLGFPVDVPRLQEIQLLTYECHTIVV